MPVSVSLDAPSGRPGLVLRYLSAVSLDKGVLHNSLPPMGKVAREAGRKRSSPHVAIRAYAPIDVVSATRTSSVFGKTMQAFFAKSTFPKGEGYFGDHRPHLDKSELSD